MSEQRIEQLERLIPKLKKGNKLLPQAIESLEWELKALKLQEKLKIKINSELKNYSFDDIENYLDTLGYSVIKDSELEYMEERLRNHPG